MFDCVLPIRLARHGMYDTSRGKIIKHRCIRKDFQHFGSRLRLLLLAEIIHVHI